MRDATQHRIHGISDERGAEWILHQPGVWTAPRDLNEALAAGLGPKALAVNISGNHGRWIVGCPDCNNAQLAAPKDHRFMCNVCGNAVIDGLWRPVVWPRDSGKLATILNQRGSVDTRNYEPGETAADLLTQNHVLDGAQVIDGIRILPVVETDGDKGAVASEHEGHEHKWPKRVEPRQGYECPGCGLTLDGGTIRKTRDEARTPAQTAEDEKIRLEKGRR